ncbi:hypothetical protein EV383_2645 [Pseudonocardia sediminis]|uniref:Wadjet protein JetD C-terminal domain-containing protein n=2 Tax=Pseudonocardia sediminis TaxID=1397368 RepID=A0A4Q7UVG1_PSEST|nr:hypothetical protein EV383_2645 [Pseudonocardia sediminis]
MHDPDHVMDQVGVRYDKNWRDWLLSGTETQFSFALGAPSAQVIGRDFESVSRWVNTWHSWAEAHPAAHLRSTTRRTVVGSQKVPTHLDVPTLDDLVSLDPVLANHWQRANERWSRIRALPTDVLVPRLRPRLQQILDLANHDFEVLLEAVRWFVENPRSGLTTRQVPVTGMHTKWLARNRGLVLACLNSREEHSADGYQIDDELEQAALDPLGLTALPVHVNLIIADPVERARIGGLRHISAPLPEVTSLPVQPDTVLIVENKESAYLVPDRPRTVIVHSLGNHLNVLDQIGWLTVAADQLYWGDLDRAGFTLLSRARARLPHLVSVLMDPMTLHQHGALAVADDTRVDLPEPNLTDAEAAALAALTTEHRAYLRLEQERLPAPFALNQLFRALERHTRDGAR